MGAIATGWEVLNLVRAAHPEIDALPIDIDPLPLWR
jgi:hypothetical protein